MDSIHPRPERNKNQFSIHVCTFDMQRAQNYFAALESLAREARCSCDPRVQRVALRLIEMQPANVRDLIGKV